MHSDMLLFTSWVTQSYADGWWHRYVEQEQDSRRYPGGPGPGALEELREACRGAMRYAQKYNAYVEECGGQAALIRSWQTFVEITFTRR